MTLSPALDRLLAAQPPFRPGEVWLAGAGPGGADCLTLGVAAALAAADAVVYDALVDPTVIALAEKAEHHFVGKRGGRPSIKQPAINQLLVDLAGAGKRVLRLKGGDPFLFGRGGDEALALTRAGVPFRVLPGVTAASGAAAAAVIPTTMRGVNKAIILVTGHAAASDDDVDWAALAASGQPMVIYMGLRNLPLITAALLAGGLDPATPAAAVMWATLPDQNVVVSTLGAIAGAVARAGLHAPSLIFIGDIVDLRAQLLPALAP